MTNRGWGVDTRENNYLIVLQMTNGGKGKTVEEIIS